jgi:aldehyde:ferredoxin oxidoreductase
LRPVVGDVPRFEEKHGWANRLLHIDLTHMRIEVQETQPYLPAFLGGRGLAARLCWDMAPGPVEPLDAANPLMIVAGALTGSAAPYSGRASVCAFSPQAYPKPWFTRSNIGGYFGGQLKRAGYDAVVVTGAAEAPVRIRIRDDEVSILPADDLWGLDTMDTLEALGSAEGKEGRALVIGPAGERLSRIATIQTASASACGHGGFGAVMGSKKLKAISARGTGRVSLARPEAITAIARAMVRIFAADGKSGPLDFYGDIQAFDRELAAAGDGRAERRACTESCISPCVAHLRDVPGVAYPERTWSGDWVCVGRDFMGTKDEDPPQQRAIYDWQLGRRAAFEQSVLSNRYGLNQADLVIGMVPWLIACQKAGLISEINGQPMDWRSPTFWAEFLRAIAYREGMGDVLAEGGWAAAQILGLGEDLARQRYPGWGCASHCDPFGWGAVTFPYWLVSALQWLSDTRDPFNSGPGYLWAESAAEKAAGLATEAERRAALERLRAVGRRVYGSADAVDPYGGYGGKAFVGYHQRLRSVVKDCLPTDAHFPLIYRPQAADGIWRLSGVEGLGEIEGPAVEGHLFAAGTGVDWDEGEFERAAERVLTVERALQVRYYGRDRGTDELVLPYFERTEPYQSPFLDRRCGLDRAQFGPVVDEFYRLHGWDVEMGWPTRERMRALDVEDLYEPMVEGARQASKDQEENHGHQEH